MKVASSLRAAHIKPGPTGSVIVQFPMLRPSSSRVESSCCAACPSRRNPSSMPTTSPRRRPALLELIEPSAHHGGWRVVVPQRSRDHACVAESLPDKRWPRLAGTSTPSVVGESLEHGGGDRKSTRLNSSHSQISYAV